MYIREFLLHRRIDREGGVVEKVSMSHEDYLEAIVMLGGSQSKTVRSVDIATKMGVSKASVSKAVTSLRTQVCLSSLITEISPLPEDGYKYGCAVLKRDEMLTRFLVEKVGLSEEVAEDEACQIGTCN